MKTRLITAGVGLLILAVVLACYNLIVIDIMAFIVCLLAIYEAFCAFGLKKEIYIFVGIAIYTAAVFLGNHYISTVYFLSLTFLLIVYLSACLVKNFEKINFAKLGGFLFFAATVIISFYSIIYIKWALPVEYYGYLGLYFIMIGLGSAWGGDGMAYFAGRLFGKRKLAPRVSPNKTVEGAIGGVIGSMLIGVLVTLIFTAIAGDDIGFANMSLGITQYLTICALCAVCSVFGILGDLFASVVKRQSNIKDYGTIFPGHGGILDRFDSVMFISPVMYTVVVSPIVHVIVGV